MRPWRRSPNWRVTVPCSNSVSAPGVPAALGRLRSRWSASGPGSHARPVGREARRRHRPSGARRHGRPRHDAGRRSRRALHGICGVQHLLHQMARPDCAPAVAVRTRRVGWFGRDRRFRATRGRPRRRRGLGCGGVSAEGAVITVSKHDAEGQIIRGHHVEITAAGNRLRPWLLHYRTPEQLDASAAAAGFVLQDRWTDWVGTALRRAYSSPTGCPSKRPICTLSIYRRRS